MRVPAKWALVCGLLGALIAWGSDSARTAEWRAFTSETGRFSVEMPGTPESRATHTDSFIGTITNHIFVVWNDGRKFTVDYSDLPGLAVDFAGRDTIYDHTKGALLKKTLSKATSYEDVTVQGVKGKQLVYDMPPRAGHAKMHGQAYLLLDHDRLYVFDAELPVADSERAAERFLSSIRIHR